MSDISVHDGQRLQGRIVQRREAFEAIDPTGKSLGKFDRISSARAAILRVDREQQVELDRLVDDGGRAA